MEELNTSQAPKIQLRTYNPVQEYQFIWKVENYSKIPLDLEENSLAFSVEPRSTWYATIVKNRRGLCFYFHRICSVLPVEVTYKFTVSDFKGKVIYVKESSYACKVKESYENIAPPEDTWCKVIQSMNNEKNDILIFTVFIKVLLPRITKVVSCELAAENVQQKLLKELSEDFLKLLGDRINTDVALTVQDQEMSAHKAILSARSTVFAKMFQQDGVDETKYNIVKIDDVTMPVLTELIAYLYSGKIKDYDFQIALELYYAADKYAILDLREICARVLVSKMTQDDVLKLLNLADLHQDIELKDQVMHFIKTH